MDKRRVFIPMRRHMVFYGKHLFAYALQSCLSEMGFDAQCVPSAKPRQWGIRKNDICFYVDAATTKNTLYARSKESVQVYFNMEPAEVKPHYPERNRQRVWSYMNRVLRSDFDVVFDYNGNTTKLWQSKGQKAYLLPIAYHESYERPRAEPLRRAVHFLGNECYSVAKLAKKGEGPGRKDRRGILCDEIRSLGARCRSHNFRDRPQEQLDRLLWTPGVHLNLHRFPSPFQFGGLRVIAMLMANRRFVLTEECHWLPPGLVAGEHWDVATPHDLPQRAADWLSRPRACEAIGQAGYEFIKKHHRLDVELTKAMVAAGLFGG